MIYTTLVEKNEQTDKWETVFLPLTGLYSTISNLTNMYIHGGVSKWGVRDGKFASGVCFEGLFRGSVSPKLNFPALLKVALQKKKMRSHIEKRQNMGNKKHISQPIVKVYRLFSLQDSWKSQLSRSKVILVGRSTSTRRMPNEIDETNYNSASPQKKTSEKRKNSLNPISLQGVYTFFKKVKATKNWWS